MNYSDIINATRFYCESLIKQSICKHLPFHNWKHTLDVVSNSNLIGNTENINERDFTVLRIAAYFHDVGHLLGATMHEEISVEYAREFLELQGVSADVIIDVCLTIKATSLKVEPQTRIQKIIRDADLAHLGQISFKEKNETLRKEWRLLNALDLTDLEWILLNINFLERHTYFTQTAKNLFSKQKKCNLDDLHQLKNELKAKL